MRRPLILIVDDERLIRWSLQQKLSASGYDAHDVETGEDALRFVEAERPDIVLLDVRLPGIDGVEVLRRVRAADPAIRVVMLSAGDAVEQAIRCRREGAFDYLVKPFDLASVLRVVERAVAAGPAAERRRVPGRVVGGSAALLRSLADLRAAAGLDPAPVLLTGEAGTGKALFAEALHEWSPRAERPFLRIHCASVPEHLCEFEMFGHERGGLAAGEGPRRGLLERAAGGTLYLEEIGALRPVMQGRLFSLLADGSFRRVGGSARIPLEVRIAAGTCRDLARGAVAGWFRPELLARFAGATVRLPSLRERKDDVPILVDHFVSLFSARYGRGPCSVTEEARAALGAWDWPGNVHELRSVVERAVLEASDGVIGAGSLPAEIREGRSAGRLAPARVDTEARWES